MYYPPSETGIYLVVQHGGRPATLNAIRSHGFWVVSGNAQVKKLIYNCVLCRKYRGRLGEQKMADLPEDRVSESAPFTHCGVDVFGPFVVKEGRKNIKRFVSLFTCFSSRAIHLEALSNQTTDSFIRKTVPRKTWPNWHPSNQTTG